MLKYKDIDIIFTLPPLILYYAIVFTCYQAIYYMRMHYLELTVLWQKVSYIISYLGNNASIILSIRNNYVNTFITIFMHLQELSANQKDIS